jgi:GMP synthase-like glutamine amidotransferase
VRFDLGEEVPADLSGFDRVVSLGSDHAADDDSVPWQATEQRTLQAAADADVPVLGICFGGQSLARALGGGVRRAARPELGWVSVGARDHVISDGPWLCWHNDEMLPPEGAEVLAANDSGVQAWRLGRHVGLQFHPEAHEALIGRWIDGSRDNGKVPDPDGLAAETARVAPGARERALVLFDTLLG